jgi:hypothetical protein
MIPRERDLSDKEILGEAGCQAAAAIAAAAPPLTPEQRDFLAMLLHRPPPAVRPAPNRDVA